MKVLVTGAQGFIGRNLVATLNETPNLTVLSIDVQHSIAELQTAVLEAEFIFHLAGVNRPETDDAFFEGNQGLTETIVETLLQHQKATPLLITSSIQAVYEHAYGQSKKAAEAVVQAYGEKSGARTFIYRLPNVFGKGCRPNYNSAIATFCYNIARGEDIWVNDRSIELQLVYIDDVISCFVQKLFLHEKIDGYCEVTPVHATTLGQIVDCLAEFKASRQSTFIPNMGDAFTKKLYSTYLSYLPQDQFSYPLKMNVDDRGSFTEFIKTKERGQVSVNISKPGITKGNHWHHTKNEKFLVVSGRGVIRFRALDSHEIIEYPVSGETLEVVDIPVGYTHNIENTGDTEMVTIMWVNEVFDPEQPDTFFLEV